MFAWNGYRPLKLSDGKFMRILRTSFGILLLLAFLGKTWGQEPFPRGSYDARLSALEAEIANLHEQLDASQSLPHHTLSGLPPPPSLGLPPLPTVPEAAANPGPSVKVSGFFHLDSVWFSQDETNIDTVGDLQDGVDFRRSRLGVSGNLLEGVSYMMEYDFAASQALFTDVWVTFSDVPLLGNIRLGRWRQPFGMSELTSVRSIPFMERPLMQPLAPFRQTGLGFYDVNAAENLTWAASVIRYPSDNFGDNVGDDGGYGVVARTTMLPFFDPCSERLIHLGGGYYYADPSRDVTRFASPPEIQVVDSLGGLLPSPAIAVPPFVDTGFVPTDSVQGFNAELAGAWGAMLIQSEVRLLQLNQAAGESETIEAAYVHWRYVLTGERIPYERKSGVFGRLVPYRDVNIYEGSWGAWELAARWSYANFNGNWLAVPPDAAGPGRRLHDLTLGTNWYLNQHAKMQFNYIHAMLNSPDFGDSTAGIFAVRCQVDF